MKIYPLLLPMRTVDGGINLRVKLMSTVVETDSHLMIIDTGWTNFPEDLKTALAAIGFAPTDFDMVINTHVHPDHAGNNYLFENARIILSREDLEFAQTYSTEMIASSNPTETFLKWFPDYPHHRAERHAAYSKKLTTRFWKPEVIGLPERFEWIEDNPELPDHIRLLHTPGHTPGHYSVCIAGRNSSLYVTGDALPAKIFWRRKLRELAPRWDSVAFEKSKAAIEELDGIILGGHDRPFYSSDKKYIAEPVLEL